ncbi:MAG: hypothetical protein ACOCZM_01725 [Bacillota bacterium]
MKNKITGMFGGRPYIFLVIFILMFTVVNFMQKTGEVASLSLRLAGGLPFVILLLEVQDSRPFAYFGYFVLAAVLAAEMAILIYII